MLAAAGVAKSMAVKLSPTPQVLKLTEKQDFTVIDIIGTDHPARHRRTSLRRSFRDRH
jgi:hypothetical protein